MEPITIKDIITYFIALGVLGYITGITVFKRTDLWKGIVGIDGIPQPVEMLIAEYLIIMPSVVVSSVFLQVPVEHDVWEFMGQITGFLLAGQIGKTWINKHYDSKTNNNDNSKGNTPSS